MPAFLLPVPAFMDYAPVWPPSLFLLENFRKFKQ
jgi:hypothetical protein